MFWIAIILSLYSLSYYGLIEFQTANHVVINSIIIYGLTLLIKKVVGYFIK